MAMTPEQRKAADAARKRASRAAAAADRERERRNAADAAKTSAPSVMRAAVEKSIAAMAKWIVDSDAAAVEQVRMLAMQVDLLTHSGDVVKALSAHGRLTTALDHLGATPVVRLQHELRSRKLDSSEVSDDGDSGQTAGSNVSQFKRPAKRASR